MTPYSKTSRYHHRVFRHSVWPGSSPRAYSAAKLLPWVAFRGNGFCRLARCKDVSLLCTVMATQTSTSRSLPTALEGAGKMYCVTKAAVRERTGLGGFVYETSSVLDLSGQLTPVCES